MREYKIKSDGDVFLIRCDRVLVNEEGRLDVIVQDEVQGCFGEWEYFYLDLSDDDANRYFKGFSYKPPKEDGEAVIVGRIVDALKDLHDVVNAE